MAVETEEIGRAHGAVGASHVLSRVVEIGETEVELRRQLLHVREGVLGIGLRIVAHDRRNAKTHVLQLARITADAVDDGLDIGTVIADEHQ